MLDAVRERGLVLLGCGKMGSAMLEGWLQHPEELSKLLGVDESALNKLSPEELIDYFKERLKEQTEQHDGDFQSNVAFDLEEHFKDRGIGVSQVMTGDEILGGSRCPLHEVVGVSRLRERHA